MAMRLLDNLAEKMVGLRHSRRHRTGRPRDAVSVERLEQKDLPSVTTGMEGSVLKVRGGDSADYIGLEIAGLDILVNGVRQAATAQRVSRIDVAGKGGDDVIQVLQSGEFRKPIQIFGDEGNDRITVDVRGDGSANYSVYGDGQNGGSGYDMLDVPNWIPAGLSADVEWRSLSRLALAQQDLRDSGHHPEMLSFNNGQVNFPPISSGLSSRDALTYQQVIEQFEVTWHGRYKQDSYTKCNVYAGDVLRAMSLSLPTKNDLGGIDGGGDYTLGARRLNDWLSGNKTWTNDAPTGPAQGWRQLDRTRPEDFALLLQHVRSGRPALASTSDHVAVVRPDQAGSTTSWDQAGELIIAQAGGKNFSRGTLANGWGNSRVNQVQFFVYDPDYVAPTVNSLNLSANPIQPGRPLTFNWNASDDRGVHHTALYLMRDGANVNLSRWGGTADGSFSSRTLSLPASGSFTWNIPSNFPTGNYAIRLVAWDAAGNRGYRDESLRIAFPSATAPTSFTARKVSTGEVQLNWSGAQYAEGYRVWVWDYANNRSGVLATLSSTTNSYRTRLAPNQTYAFLIEAFNSSGTAYTDWRVVKL